MCWSVWWPRCMEDLLSTTRYVTWSLHSKVIIWRHFKTEMHAILNAGKFVMIVNRASCMLNLLYKIALLMIVMCWLSDCHMLGLKNSYLFVHIKDVFLYISCVQMISKLSDVVWYSLWGCHCSSFNLDPPSTQHRFNVCAIWAALGRLAKAETHKPIVHSCICIFVSNYFGDTTAPFQSGSFSFQSNLNLKGEVSIVIVVRISFYTLLTALGRSAQAEPCNP